VEAIDTHVLIWGVRRHVQEGREDMIARCERLIEKIKATHSTIMLPSIVVSEYLIGFDLDAQMRQREILSKNYFVAPFDTKAGWIAAELYDKGVFDRAREESKLGKQCLKADLMIVATAIAHGATCIWVDDGHIKTLARGRILVKIIPTLAELAEAEITTAVPKGKEVPGRLFSLDEDEDEDE
jgi:predicted nucleic acid-binding protein